MSPVLRRKCRNPACRFVASVALVVAGCPRCHTSYGPITVGLDFDPKVARQMDRDTRADIDRAFNERMEAGRRDDIRRLVAGIDEPER